MSKRKAKSKPRAVKAAKPDPQAVGQVQKWILEGATERDIAEAIEAQWPDASARPVIVAAMQEIVKAADADPEAVAAWCFEATRHVYAKAIKQGDFGAALRALKMIQDAPR